MLRLMREKFKHLKWILWAVIGSFILFIFVAWGIGGGGGMGTGSDPVAGNAALSVDGRLVTRLDFRRQMIDTTESYRRQFRDLPAEQVQRFLTQMKLGEQVRDGLVQRLVALREAERAGIQVSDADVRDYLIRSFVDEGGTFIGRERLERIIRSRGYSDGEFRQAVREDLAVRRLQAVVEAGAVVREDEVKAEYLSRKEEASVEYVLADPRTLAADLRLSEAELKAFHAAHPETFARDERKASYVFFSVPTFAAKATVSDAELRDEQTAMERFGGAGEKRHARHILLKTEAAAGDPATLQAISRRAEEIASRARAQESFETLARTYSEDEGSRDKGGDLGSFGRGAMVKPFEDAVFAMSPSEVRGPVQTEYGYHVIQLLEVLPAKTFAEMRPELERAVRERKARELARAAAVDAIAQHPSEGDLAALTALGASPLSETSYLREDDATAAIPGVDAAYVPGFLRGLFAVPEPGKLGADPLPVGDGFAVLKLVDRRGPITPPFEAIRTRVEEELRAERGRELAKAHLATLREGVAKGKSLLEAATAAGLTAATGGPFRRGGTIPGIARSEAAAKAAFELPLDIVSEPIELPTATVVMRVTQRFAFDAAQFEAEKDEVRASLETTRKSELWSALIRAARKDLEERSRIEYLAPDLWAATDEEPL